MSRGELTGDLAAAFGQRLVVLAGLALLAGVVALAVATQRGHESVPSDLPRAVPAPGGGWYRAIATARTGPVDGRRTACGYALARDTAGVIHPALTCQTKLYVRYGETQVLTQVVANSQAVASQFSLTPALARTLGLRGTDLIDWRYAGR